MNGEEAEEAVSHPEASADTEGSSPCVSRREMIQNVLEEDGVIRRSTERMREVIREGYGSEWKDETTRMDWEKMGAEREEAKESVRKQGAEREEDRESMREQDAEIGDKARESDQTKGATAEGDEIDNEEEKKRRRRLRVLLDVLTSIRDVVKKQAQRRPDETMNEYQVEKINPVLEEIIKIEKEMGMGDLLETIRKTEKGADGKVEVKGMSYGDIEVLLEYFNSVVWFTQSEML